MAISFVKPWAKILPPSEPVNPLVPRLDVAFQRTDGRFIVRRFLIDSGADVSMAPRSLCEELCLDWETGEPLQLNGISPKPECAIPARVFQIEMLVPEIGIAFFIPICFADGDTTRILGREGFFDAFAITFNKQRLTTRFELLE